ncbi:biotin--[acetyl-CoA-carboxylase] ligase [Methanococcus voltae]|uniref:BirA family biotin operon repressor/biotin-[acetyl-CoA-carboxylase] ligase n=2 Tax=Methanococcus voltae TaxID=2188 RepID=A0A8J7URG5_METVO|nr:biotin--[acetyl-CoA-carboxylase] ligase [Methanococcus voltae]MBP2172812.1 BirA family biotin operon repressor/biotin-[acetyl-CoA-carboxylase] ligase [Methanococcus voltae]MBP2201778.1 BirA family biotin operon repressor/biotin-[acetyl-CoA-carboxylase] ligase [Methanococcus voltae]MCS3922602.1 BirA family biotin operon repressor/biotin-[acetyl-CoA-carboxylase] ligase [Methanococcus voltae PS]
MKFKVFKYDKVNSTNIVSHNLAKNGQNNFIVMANTQTDGKGRLNRSWASEEGGLYLSIVLDISKFEEIAHSNFIASLSVLTTLKEFSSSFNTSDDINYSIKWPNDILLNNCKICGILSELNIKENYIVIGIGVNLNNSLGNIDNDCSYKAISLNQMFENTEKEQIDKNLFLTRLLSNFTNYLTMNSDDLINNYKLNSETLNKNVKIILKDSELTGKVVNIDFNGLYLDTNSDLGIKLIEVGDCIHLR